MLSSLRSPGLLGHPLFHPQTKKKCTAFRNDDKEDTLPQLSRGKGLEVPCVLVCHLERLMSVLE